MRDIALLLAHETTWPRASCAVEPEDGRRPRQLPRRLNPEATLLRCDDDCLPAGDTQRSGTHTRPQFAEPRKLAADVLRKPHGNGKKPLVRCIKCENRLGVHRAQMIQSHMITGRSIAVQRIELRPRYTPDGSRYGTPPYATHPPRVSTDSQDRPRCATRDSPRSHTSGPSSHRFVSSAQVCCASWPSLP